MESLSANKSVFERAFTKKERVSISGGGIDVVDIPAPALSDKKPLILSPAWGMGPEVYKYILKGFSDAGRRTLSFTYPSKGGTTELLPEDKELVKDFPAEEVRDALTLMSVLEARGVEEGGVLGHSKGGASAAIAALLFAERAARGEGKKRIANIILFGSAGLIGKDSLPRLGYGFAAQKSNRGKQSESFAAIPVSDKQRADAEANGLTMPVYAAIPNTKEDAEGGAAAGVALVSHIKESGFYRTSEEVWGLSRIHIDSLLRKLKKHGIGITIMTGVDDPVFPTRRMTSTISAQLTPAEKALNYEKKIDAITENIVDGVLTIRAEHGIPVPYSGIIEGQFSALEEKQKRAGTKDGTSGG
ncbi:MAG: alpha/beta hydrolase [bacterium]|nr:alpha/beta hydrolase [bacterium]